MEYKIAYFSAEIGIDSAIKTYSGGLGILSGDTVKAMADLEVPAIAITLLYKNGFLKQIIKDNRQTEEDDNWDYQKLLSDIKKETKLKILGEDVYVKIWKYEYKGSSNFIVPILFLDTDLEKNPPWAREITKRLYQGNRLAQEMVLGVGGVRALKVLGINDGIFKYHMNEGHSAFLTLELYKDFGEKIGWDDGLVRQKCIFTTHTPIPAGHDKFEYNDIYEHFKGEPNLIPWHIKKIAGNEKLNMTLLAMNYSNYINGVSKKHQQVTQDMFKRHEIHSITNGVHIKTWLSKPFQDLFDKEIPTWRNNSEDLKQVFKITYKKIRDAHDVGKKELIKFVNDNNVTGAKLKDNVLTIGFARRFIEYKDAELIFRNKKNLRDLGNKVQFIFAGKTHVKDELGKDIMRRVIEDAIELKDNVQIAFIENYDMEVAKKLVQGCDLWLNTPVPPNEASGTSGMKAAANGCLHFSRLDGWAIESFEMNGGGFPIDGYEDFIKDLEYKIIPMFYNPNQNSWIEEMKLSIGNSGSYFNTHRMVKEYVKKAYKLKL